MEEFGGLLNTLGSVSITQGEDQHLWTIDPSGILQ